MSPPEKRFKNSSVAGQNKKPKLTILTARIIFFGYTFSSVLAEIIGLGGFASIFLFFIHEFYQTTGDVC